VEENTSGWLYFELPEHFRVHHGQQNHLFQTLNVTVQAPDTAEPDIRVQRFGADRYDLAASRPRLHFLLVFGMLIFLGFAANIANELKPENKDKSLFVPVFLVSHVRIRRRTRTRRRHFSSASEPFPGSWKIV
jgi:hypothetical protein